MRRMRQVTALGALVLTALVVIVLSAGSAGAASVEKPGPVLTTSSRTILASTGFDITTPLLVGFALLVLGIASVCWAFLRASSARRRHH